MCSCNKISVMTFILTVIISVGLIIYNVRNLGACDIDTSLQIHNATFENGNLIVSGLKFKQGEYFTDKDGVVRVCPLTYCRDHEKTCVKKCCPPKEIIKNGRCSEHDGRYFTKDDLPLDVKVKNRSESIYLFIGIPSCDDGYDESVQITKDGYLEEQTEEKLRHSIFEYCIDFEDDDGSIVDYSFICFPPQEKQRAFEFYRYFIIASIVFFSLTFVTYASIPDLRSIKRGLHGWCLMSHIACLIIAYTTVALMQFGIIYSRAICNLLGYTLYYSFMAGFFWLNVICFDMWRVLRSTKINCLFHLDRFNNMQKYYFYFAYAFGSPLLLLIVVYLMDTFLSPDNPFKPDIGDKTCFIRKTTAIWATVYGPLSALILIDTLLFVDTVIEMIAVYKEIEGGLNDEARNKRNQNKKIVLYLKLFLVMGVSWLMEIVSFTFAENVSDLWWYPTDIFNSLRGLWIFIIFVLKRKVLRKLNKRLCPSFQIINRGNFMSSVTTYYTSSKRKSSFSRQTSKRDQEVTETTVPESSHNGNKFEKIASKKQLINGPVVDKNSEFTKGDEGPKQKLNSTTSLGSCEELQSIEQVEHRVEADVREVTEQGKQMDPEKEKIKNLTNQDVVNSNENTEEISTETKNS